MLLSPSSASYVNCAPQRGVPNLQSSSCISLFSTSSCVNNCAEAQGARCRKGSLVPARLSHRHTRGRTPAEANSDGLANRASAHVPFDMAYRTKENTEGAPHDVQSNEFWNSFARRAELAHKLSQQTNE